MPPPSPVQPEEDATPKKKRAEQLAAAVCVAVINRLGRPHDLFRISAMRLWDNRYRVNVQTGDDVVSVRVAHSFFVAIDEKGNVIESSPQITRLY